MPKSVHIFKSKTNGQVLLLMVPVIVFFLVLILFLSANIIFPKSFPQTQKNQEVLGGAHDEK